MTEARSRTLSMMEISRLLHQRDHDGGGQHDHRDAVERGAEDDIDDGQDGDQPIGPEIHRRRALRQRGRDAGQRHRLGEEGGAGYVAQADHPETRMARIALRPTWVGVLDFQNRLPEVMGG